MKAAGIPCQLVIATLLAATTITHAQGSGWTVNKGGLGPIGIGTNIKVAEKLLGVHLQREDHADSDKCLYYTPLSGFQGVQFMTSKSIIVRIEIHPPQDKTAGPTVQTDKGAGIGDTEARILSLYRDHARIGPHFYTGPEGHYIRIVDENGRVRLLFETDGKVVLNYRVGSEPAIEFVEGCR